MRYNQPYFLYEHRYINGSGFIPLRIPKADSNLYLFALPPHGGFDLLWFVLFNHPRTGGNCGLGGLV